MASNLSLNASSSLCSWPEEQQLDYNVTNYPSIYIQLILYPVLLATCSIGNLVSIAVLSTEKAKTTTNVYLICVAVADLFILWLNLPEYIMTADEKTLENERFTTNYQNYYGLGKWVAEACVQFSDWTLIIFSLERLLAVARPFSFQNWRTIPIVICIEMIILMLAAIFALQNLVNWYFMLSHDDGRSANQILPPILIKWTAVQNQAEVAITVAKWLALIIITSVLMAVLAKQRNTRSFLSHVDSDRTTMANYAHSNYILLASVALYFFTQFPNVVFKCLEVASQPPYCSYSLTRKAQATWRPFILMMTLCNYSLHFLLYCAVSKKFRAQLMFLLFKVAEFCCPGVLQTYEVNTRRLSTTTVLSCLDSRNLSLTQGPTGGVIQKQTAFL